MRANALNIFEAGFDIIPDSLNVDANTDVTGDRINLKNWERAYYLLTKPAGSAGDDLSIQFQQHDAASSGNSKALTFSKLWYKKATSGVDFTGVGTWTAVELTSPTDDLDLASVNGVDLATDTVGAMVLVEVRADSLDGANGYTFVSALHEGDDIGNALVINGHWLLWGNRYPQALPLTSLA